MNFAPFVFWQHEGALMTFPLIIGLKNTTSLCKKLMDFLVLFNLVQRRFSHIAVFFPTFPSHNGGFFLSILFKK